MREEWAAITVLAVVVVITVFSAASTIGQNSNGAQQVFGQRNQPGQQTQPNRFLSYEELENFVGSNSGFQGCYDGGYLPLPASNNAVGTGFMARLGAGEISISTDYSTTNIQVEGVDEADIMKTDGRYLYVLSSEKVIILIAYPPEEARVLATIELSESPTEIFVNDNRLVVFEASWDTPSNLPIGMYGGYWYSQETAIEIYDISNRESPMLVNKISMSGAYFSSRMIGDYIYVVVNMPVGFENDVIVLPQITAGDDTRTIPATDIYYFDNIGYPYNFAIISAINILSGKEIGENVFLTTQANDMYVSTNNIYITYTNGWYWYDEGENTVIHKISIENGKIEYKSRAEVPGYVLDQFSMDEYQGYFRIATTTGEVLGGSARNHVYVLDDNLSIVGRLEGLAPGEKIYSARFMGARAYLVTFKKIDPLFVIDLTDPSNPRTLGELKIPGYSDYLHPYDETHVIGVGKDTYDMGSFAWYQGIKIALFDVSDPANPIEISNYVIGDRGTDSYALSDHKAFLFSRSKNLLVIPVSLAEINGESYPSGEVPPNTYGETIWQGAYVFSVSVENGLVLRGRITHEENNLLDSSYYVKRSLYINDVLYTISNGLVKMNDLKTLDEIGKVALNSPYAVEIDNYVTGQLESQGPQPMGAEPGSMAGLLAAAVIAGCLSLALLSTSRMNASEL
jgi:inhibitor of cysteine peptidase